jgi:hypothetical protein
MAEIVKYNLSMRKLYDTKVSSPGQLNSVMSHMLIGSNASISVIVVPFDTDIDKFHTVLL